MRTNFASDGVTDLRTARLIAPAVVVALLVGMGMLGWLVGHVLTYDALGYAHLHADHSYMQPIRNGGIAVLASSFGLIALALVMARAGFVEWLRTTLSLDGILPWVWAAGIPAASFLTVELVAGSVAMRGGSILTLGIPLQALIGVLVLWIVHELLGGVADLIDLIAADRRMRRRSSRSTFAGAISVLAIPTPRMSPMATCAPRRGPPAATP